MKKLILIIPILFVLITNAQYEHEDTGYVWSTDEKVLQKMEEWQDLKFGLLMHWGAYSQWGIVESWSICPEDYRKIDILWLDGGWVSKKDPGAFPDAYAANLSEIKTGFIKSRRVDQDISMDELAAKARKKQPGLIVVDRAARGPNQNYLTPENRVPETQLPYPWESCFIAGGGWAWVPNPQFMSPKQANHMLIVIVAKGGNLLYNIGPAPNGT